MKTLLFLPFLFLFFTANAQHYVRTKKNIGITASYNFIENTRYDASAYRAAEGNSFAIGITHQLKHVLYPELFFIQHRGTFPTSTESPIAASPYTMNGIGAGLTTKFDLFTFDNKKKNGICFARVVNVLVGADYTYNFDITSNANLSTMNEVNGKIGLGMYSIWGGSSKNHATWTIHWEGYYKYGFSPFMKIESFRPQGYAQSFEHSSVGLTLRLMYHKSYKFSEM
ncbi:MAG: hypothetical protein M3R17_18675 [Bacteroidota bacterium]|nr:hypothetical protein [Bacteroidota bacterium]